MATDEGITPTHPAPDHGCLPAWKVADMPEPLPFTVGNTLRTIGPGAVLLAGSIGGGEWIVGPLLAVQYGRGILWIATVAIFLQMVLNLEAARYTLYTGEPIITGFMRLRPNSQFWSVFYILTSAIPLATPALALGSANVIFATWASRLPGEAGEDARTLMWISYGVLLVTAILLLSGRSVEKLLERASWVMVVLIFGFLLTVNLMFVPLTDWSQTLVGFFTPRAIPANMDIMLLALFAATAGAGGLGNLSVSNRFRDSGFGMGGHMGGIGGVLARNRMELQPMGFVFPLNRTNLARWRIWWHYALVDQSLLWAVGCGVGMFLNVNLAAAIIPSGTQLSGYAAGAFQAEYMAEFWPGFWVLCLLNGFWVLFSTHVANTDTLCRTVVDICWTGFPRIQRWMASHLYAMLLLVCVTWGAITLMVGEHALSLFKVLGVVASPIMAIAAFQILRVNTRFLPAQLRPALWARVALVACGVAYGGIAVALVVNFWQG